MKDAVGVALDDAVLSARAQLRERGIPAPLALGLFGTGIGLLGERLADAVELELGELEGVPEPWSALVLSAGRLGGTPIWLIDDLSGEPLQPEPAAGWVRAFPVWLGAASGASILLHTSAGSALQRRGAASPAVAAGAFGLVRDHLNLSGSTPLVGLAESRLGPLFPDLGALHHVGLRRAALARAEELGLLAAEVVAACTLGPALETPAERAMLAELGAEVAVQSLATPLLAAAHAGLAVLALVAVTDAAHEPAEVSRLVEAAARFQPELEDLVVALAPDVAHAARARAAEERA